MRRYLLMTFGFLGGCVLGVAIGVYLSCEVYKTGNFCAFVAYTTGPVGGLIGLVGGHFLSRTTKPKE
jgi:hypothetical protein